MQHRRGNGVRNATASALACIVCVIPVSSQGTTAKVFVNDDGTNCVLSVHLPATRAVAGTVRATAAIAPDENGQLTAATDAIRAGYTDGCDPGSNIVIAIVSVGALDSYRQANWSKVTTYGEFSISTADVEKIRHAQDSWPIEQLRVMFKRVSRSQ